MKRLWFVLITSLILQLAGAPTFAREPQKTKLSEVTLADLPREGRETVLLIKQGGPFPYKRDGAVFGNFERRLPVKERGYYREYTVSTPRSHDRGAQNHSRSKGGVLLH